MDSVTAKEWQNFYDRTHKDLAARLREMDPGECEKFAGAAADYLLWVRELPCTVTQSEAV